MSFLSLKGVDLYYELHGEGPLLVFIHGASGTHLTWWQQIAELRHHFSCLIYDQRGFGKSRPTESYDIGDGHILYDDLSRLIEHVASGDQKVSIVGASLGTGPALHYAMENERRTDKLILVCGIGGISTPTITQSKQDTIVRMKARQEGLKGRDATVADLRRRRIPVVQSAGEFERFAVAYHPYGPVGEAMHLDAPALTFLYAEIMASAGGPPTVELLPCFNARPVTAEDASSVPFPVLLVGGTEDQLFPPQLLEEAGQVFPRGRTILFKGAGHACYYEKARRFNDVLLEFLRAS